MKQLWIVRHTAVDVPKGILYGGSDVGLKATFPEEAAVVKQKLEDLDPDVVYSSPLSRASRLAEAVGCVDVRLDDRLREQNYGDWELKHYNDINDPLVNVWYEDYIYTIPPNGESFAQQVERVGSFIEEIRSMEHRAILVFAHAGVQMAAGAYLGLYEMEEAGKHMQGYGGIVKYLL